MLYVSQDFKTEFSQKGQADLLKLSMQLDVMLYLSEESKVVVIQIFNLTRLYGVSSPRKSN